jgi:FkbM family methyltransferase
MSSWHHRLAALRQPRQALSKLAWRLLFPDAVPSFAQEGEDRVLARLLADAAPGFYVDIGAHHPTRFSNTAALYLAGWHGLAVDPRPGLVELFRRRRPRDTAIELCIASTTGELEYFIFDDQALNTFSRERAEMLERTTRYRIRGRRTIPCVTLAQLLGEYVSPGQSIDVLSVDVEGLDYNVLDSNDWSRFRPGLVIAEDLEIVSLDHLEASRIARLMRGHGYTPIAKTLNSVFYRRDD